MPKVRYKPEQVATKLRQVEVLASQGNNVVDAIREIETSEAVRTPKPVSPLQMRSRQHR